MRAVRITRRQALRTFLVGGAATAVTAGGYGALCERGRIRLIEQVLPVAGLPPALGGIRIGVLTDVHHGAFLPRRELDRAVTLLAGGRPDLIALLGDYVTFKNHTHLGSCVEALARLRAPHGIFAVFGNHDDEAETARAFRRQGFEVLDGARTRLAINGETLDLAGISFWTRTRGEIGPLVRNASRALILLAHDPRRLAEAASLGVPAVLSGHTHGGQISLPVVGAVAARKFPIPAGLLRQGATTLYVSRGLGTVILPVRLNCPPEVVVLTLKSASDRPGVGFRNQIRIQENTANPGPDAGRSIPLFRLYPARGTTRRPTICQFPSSTSWIAAG
jgi:predicted MPP superfamily phosphohydrolase